MKIGDLVKYKNWHGVVTATSGVNTRGEKIVEGQEVMVLWNGDESPSWEVVYLLEKINEDR